MSDSVEGASSDSTLEKIVFGMVQAAEVAIDRQDPEELNGLVRLLVCKLTAYGVIVRSRAAPAAAQAEQRRILSVVGLCNRFIGVLESARAPYALSKRLQAVLTENLVQWRQQTAVHESARAAFEGYLPSFQQALSRGNLILFNDTLSCMWSSLQRIRKVIVKRYNLQPGQLGSIERKRVIAAPTRVAGKRQSTADKRATPQMTLQSATPTPVRTVSELSSSIMISAARRPRRLRPLGADKPSNPTTPTLRSVEGSASPVQDDRVDRALERLLNKMRRGGVAASQPASTEPTPDSKVVEQPGSTTEKLGTTQKRVSSPVSSANTQGDAGTAPSTKETGNVVPQPLTDESSQPVADTRPRKGDADEGDEQPTEHGQPTGFKRFFLESPSSARSDEPEENSLSESKDLERMRKLLEAEAVGISPAAGGGQTDEKEGGSISKASGFHKFFLASPQSEASADASSAAAGTGAEQSGNKGQRFEGDSGLPRQPLALDDGDGKSSSPDTSPKAAAREENTPDAARVLVDEDPGPVLEGGFEVSEVAGQTDEESFSDLRFLGGAGPNGGASPREALRRLALGLGDEERTASDTPVSPSNDSQGERDRSQRMPDSKETVEIASPDEGKGEQPSESKAKNEAATWKKGDSAEYFDVDNEQWLRATISDTFPDKTFEVDLLGDDGEPVESVYCMEEDLRRPGSSAPPPTEPPDVHVAQPSAGKEDLAASTGSTLVAASRPGIEDSLDVSRSSLLDESAASPSTSAAVSPTGLAAARAALGLRVAVDPPGSSSDVPATASAETAASPTGELKSPGATESGESHAAAVLSPAATSEEEYSASDFDRSQASGGASSLVSPLSAQSATTPSRRRNLLASPASIAEESGYSGEWAQD